MKTRSKALLTLLCAVALVVGSVFGTYAYLTSSDTVTNTFSVGNVTITMDESPVNNLGVIQTGDRVKANSYHLLPGHLYTKDPTIHVDANSENCWLFVKVDNGIAAIEAATTETKDGTTDYQTIVEQMEKDGNWTPVAGTVNVYAYKEISKAGDNVIVFNEFMVSGTVSNDILKTYNPSTDKKISANIVVTAYAVQADGFNTAEAAWTAAPIETWKTPNP